MSYALRSEQDVPGPESVLLVADSYAKFTLQDVKDLVLGTMNM